MSKGRCPSRAEWCFELGKPPKQLSPHYRLDCDHGTAIMLCWETGGSEPVYLCESHAEEQKRRENRAAAGRPSARAGSDGDSACGSAKPKAEPIPNGESAANSNFENPVEAKPVEVSPAPEIPVASNSESSGTDEAVAKPTEAATESCEEPPVAPAPAPGEAPAAKADEPPKTTESSATKPQSPPPAEPAPAVPVAKPVRIARDSSLRHPARDLTFGNPPKAIVDEAVWNLPPGDHEAFRAALKQGKPAVDAAQAAGGQLATIHRRITEYSFKLDAILAASPKAISVQETIDKPLEQSMLEVIESDSMTDSEKDAAIQQLGALQEWAKYGLQAQLTPLEAHRGIVAIGTRMNWGGTAEISELLRAAHRALFASLKKAIHAAAPDAQELLERVINLHAAKSDLIAQPAPELQPK